MSTTYKDNAMGENRLGNFPFSDELRRKQWVKEGLVKAGKTGFFAKFKSRSITGAIYSLNKELQVDNKGNEIIFDFDGFISQRPQRGNAQVSGTGTNQKKFSASMNTQEFHNTVLAPQHWDLAEIGSIQLRKTAHLRGLLSNLHSRLVDQGIFDTIQGVNDNDVSHKIMPNGKTDVHNLASTDKPSLDLLEHIIYVAETGEHANVGGKRPAMKAWTDSSVNGEENQVIDLVCDFYFLDALSRDEGWRALYGSILATTLANNPMLSGVITSHKNIRLHRAPRFEGSTYSRLIIDSAVETAGMRRYDAVNDKWTGEEGFDPDSAKMVGVAVIMGAGAIITHGALRPYEEFTIEKSNHSGNKEAGFHYYFNAKRTQLFAHNGDYAMRNMTGYDLGLINVYYSL